jgi:hypothetical protein
VATTDIGETIVTFDDLRFRTTAHPIFDSLTKYVGRDKFSTRTLHRRAGLTGCSRGGMSGA